MPSKHDDAMLRAIFPRAGDLFDTPYERGCRALESADDLGGFIALDSERVVCTFDVCMIERIYRVGGGA